MKTATPQHSTAHTATRAVTVLLLAACLVPQVGCRKKAQTTDDTSSTAPRVEELATAPLKVTLTTAPGTVRVDRDILATLRVEAPSQTDVTLPPLDDRFQGFALSGAYDAEPSHKDGRTTIERRLKLTPLVADEYRLAPIVIEYVNRGQNPPVSSWVTTRSVLFPVQKLEVSGDTLDLEVRPHRIRPSAKTIALWCAAVLSIIALGFLLWKLLSRVHEEIRLARMDPKQRALHELDRLLAKDLLGKNLVKDFYVELTMIVRRYIERAHGVRAPEQTTEEFLQSMTANEQFPPDVANRLRTFLQSADLVKFAAYLPPRESTGAAVDTARDYIVSDASVRNTDTPAQAPATKGG